MEPEIKMEKFEAILIVVKKLRTNELDRAELNEAEDTLRKDLQKLGITCGNVTNCIEAGRLCYKCKNNYARRSYFRDLLQRDSPMLAAYAADASCFDAVERTE